MSTTLTYVESHSETSVNVGVVVAGPTNRADLFADMGANLPAAYDGLVLNKVNDVKLAEGQTDVWEGSVRYAAYRKKQDLKSGEMEFNFRTSARQVTRTVSISSRYFDQTGERGSNPVLDPLPPDAQLIHWNKAAGACKGVVVDETSYSFSWVVMVPFTTANDTWLKSVGEKRGLVNSSPFFGYAAGEVKFVDFDSTIRSDSDHRMRFEFERRPNTASITIGAGDEAIELTNVKGWEYIEVIATKFKMIDEDNPSPLVRARLVPVVEAVKLHQVAYEGDFSVFSSILGV